jgi:biopolymer transport protein ExbB/TolQ
MVPASVQALYDKGGATLVVIFLLSIAALAVGLERFLATWTYRRRMAASRDRIMEHLAEKNRTMAQAVNQSMPWHPATALFAMVLSDKQWKMPELRRAQSRIVRAARRRLWILASIGSIAPFVGLFGTVVGVMQAFQQIGLEGTGGFQVVSSGISEALVATAGGIFVGIEAVILFNALQVYVTEYTALLKEAAEELHETASTEVPSAVPSTQAG